MDESSFPDPVELASQATEFIRKAASILEKEMAAGIVAAHSLEKRLVDVDGIRNRSPDDLMQRFRRDAHEVVDLVIDVLAVGVRSAERIADQAIQTARADSQESGADTSGPRANPRTRRKGR